MLAADIQRGLKTMNVQELEHQFVFCCNRLFSLLFCTFTVWRIDEDFFSTLHIIDA